MDNSLGNKGVEQATSNKESIDLSTLFKSKRPRSSGKLRKKPDDRSSKASGWDEEPTRSAVVTKDSKTKGSKASVNPLGFSNAAPKAQLEANPLLNKVFTPEELLAKRQRIQVLYKADDSENFQSAKKQALLGATATTLIDGVENPDSDSDTNKEVVVATEDSRYSGQKGYNTYIKKREGTGNSKLKAGPIRAPSHLRITSRFDYAPDICKDYKETGFCGYGDSCKFLHDRGDYKSGWQIEQEWEMEQAAKREKFARLNREMKEGDESSEEEEEKEEELPFACLICRGPFVNPVITKCGHYFCEACALKQYTKTPKCNACGAGTQGIFDVAKKLIERLKKMPEAPTSDNDAPGSPEPVSEVGYSSESEP
ncbi:RNA-splicing factor [Entomophthora muscae]|uniref:RNA-splicing factor n=1 Tax=Entomophthora muscae TaxID=34485 RepID=A0ACC2S5I0_9FUNG|nr:RNA-splicing factor [Entomophthora muscae]